MKMAKVRFLEKGEQPCLPKWAEMLPQKWQKIYMEKKRPYCWKAETAILQTEAENSMTAVWRKNAGQLLEEMKKEGISIVIPPLKGELPRDILPFASGRRLLLLFAFIGAAEALKRQGKNPAECRYLLAGGNEKIWRAALVSMGNEVNHLAIFTAEVKGAEKLEQELFEEHGLMADVFASPKNPLLSQADVIFGCGLEQRNYGYLLKEGAVWFDLAGNRPVLRKLQEARTDITVIDGFFFRKGEKQMEGNTAEAETFLSCPVFRENWLFPPEETVGKEILCALKRKGYVVSGFSRSGNRVKIQKKP